MCKGTISLCAALSYCCLLLDLGSGPAMSALLCRCCLELGCKALRSCSAKAKVPDPTQLIMKMLNEIKMFSREGPFLDHRALMLPQRGPCLSPPSLWSLLSSTPIRAPSSVELRGQVRLYGSRWSLRVEAIKGFACQSQHEAQK